MDRNEAVTLFAHLERHLKDFAEANNVAIDFGNLRYDAASLTTRITIKTLAASGSSATTSPGITCTAHGEAMAKRHYLDINKPNPKGLRIVDYNDRAHKMPWLVVDSNGKRWKMNDYNAKLHFGLPVTPPGTPPKPAKPSNPGREAEFKHMGKPRHIRVGRAGPL